MNAFKLSLRLSGELPPLNELTQSLGITPTVARRRGEVVTKRRTQPFDIWSLTFVESDDYDEEEQKISQLLQQAAATLQKMTPVLASLNQTNCKADLYISTIRETDQGGFSLPPEIVTAAAAANLSIEVSILVMLDDYEEPQVE